MIHADTAVQAARFVLAGGALDGEGQQAAHPVLCELLRSDPTVAGLVESGESTDRSSAHASLTHASDLSRRAEPVAPLEQRCTGGVGRREADGNEQRALAQLVSAVGALLGDAVQRIEFDEYAKCVVPHRYGAHYTPRDPQRVL
jgi:hypothetical protein